MKCESHKALTSRQSANGRVKGRDKSVAGDEHSSLSAYQEIIHDLQVHQTELAQQNEELLEMHAKLEESRAQYVDLYDNAPVGYLSLEKRTCSKNL